MEREGKRDGERVGGGDGANLSESKGYVKNFDSNGTSGNVFLNCIEHNKSFLVFKKKQ